MNPVIANIIGKELLINHIMFERGHDGIMMKCNCNAGNIQIQMGIEFYGKRYAETISSFTLSGTNNSKCSFSLQS